ncbi:hypothetical protein CAOG_02402 [Capsaspora owczarzaki ATCC 30864]|uniref:Uncharacterized protein n=1 Tax=Capsaspora owczarzaki (strain ATCC 30864) TaxID=595528 RepID=A0A0D2VM75_CAPO3|nr:hypothetical protein CAOG_02402 [Capsaspora owczarzaki ATCC 30864]KJE91237.1 hypothetical protein CAOG_002402 [Capsaspora owczarzaki ATCC 30864]|eukprot:XP_004349152.1 hypothetical protein CAOG_02402 [Capsaspora owczarzaki ATCC 30864]
MDPSELTERLPLTAAARQRKMQNAITASSTNAPQRRYSAVAVVQNATSELSFGANLVPDAVVVPLVKPRASRITKIEITLNASCAALAQAIGDASSSRVSLSTQPLRGCQSRSAFTAVHRSSQQHHASAIANAGLLKRTDSSNSSMLDARRGVDENGAGLPAGPSSEPKQPQAESALALSSACIGPRPPFEVLDKQYSTGQLKNSDAHLRSAKCDFPDELDSLLMDEDHPRLIVRNTVALVPSCVLPRVSPTRWSQSLNALDGRLPDSFDKPVHTFSGGNLRSTTVSSLVHESTVPDADTEM